MKNYQAYYFTHKAEDGKSREEGIRVLLQLSNKQTLVLSVDSTGEVIDDKPFQIMDTGGQIDVEGEQLAAIVGIKELSSFSKIKTNLKLSKAKKLDRFVNA